MMLVLALISLVLLGIMGISESFAEKASGKPVWETNSDKVCGDKLCSEIERIEKINRETLVIESQQVQIEIITWDDFEYEFQGDAAIFRNNLGGFSILEAGTKYYVIQKAEFKAESFGNKDTRVNATIGFAIQKGDKMLRPPMGEKVTDSEHEEFNRQMVKFNKEFPKQSTIGNSYDFVVDVENPFYVKFPLVINESGQYTRQFYKTTHIFEGPTSSGMGGLTVVKEFSKALDENGLCKNEDHRRLIKHDYSTLVCVDYSSAIKLKERGWGL